MRWRTGSTARSEAIARTASPMAASAMLDLASIQANLRPPPARPSAPLVQVPLDPRDVPLGKRADLRQIAQLMGDPEPAALGQTRLRAFAPRQRILDQARVANLAHELVAIPPEAHDPAA